MSLLPKYVKTLGEGPVRERMPIASIDPLTSQSTAYKHNRSATESGPSFPPSLRYGVGYRMIVVKDPSCVSSQVTSLVTSLVDGSKNITDIGTELAYVLPSGSSGSFPQLFDTLDG